MADAASSSIIKFSTVPAVVEAAFSRGLLPENVNIVDPVVVVVVVVISVVSFSCWDRLLLFDAGLARPLTCSSAFACIFCSILFFDSRFFFDSVMTAIAAATSSGMDFFVCCCFTTEDTTTTSLVFSDPDKSCSM